MRSCRMPSQDAVLMSAGDRYEELARRVQANYGKFDAAGAPRPDEAARLHDLQPPLRAL